ncbi:MAG: CCA tRNA nucleotidyltransferase [Archaeoglobales archaeon]|nr:MAG: CCA tRNA nucleotidyltransferase [Archaeoglobales archaeon]
MEAIIRRALDMTLPSEEEVERARRSEEEIRRRLEKILKDHPKLDYRFLGSYARNTWLKDNLEIDVFILFPEETPMDELERLGLEIGKAVVDEFELRYAAHPYVHGKVLGVDVDVVPCYRVKSPREIRSAVDRTPFHHDWLKDRVKGRENEVRLLKMFLKANEIYGAEYKVRGFSGYLCELLIVFYGSFLNVLRGALSWRRNTVIDIPNGRVYKGREFFVVDPVDPRRNVAANLSLENLAKFVQLCREFLRNPSIDFFKRRDLISDEDLKREIEGRVVLVVEFERPDVVEDNLYPQLEKACGLILKNMREFQPLRYGFVVDERCYMIFEFGVKELSRFYRHMGPMFEDEENVERFLRKNERVFIEGGRFWSLRERRFLKPRDAMTNVIERNWIGMGKNVGKKVREGFEIFEGFEILKIKSVELRRKLRDVLCIKHPSS